MNHKAAKQINLQFLRDSLFVYIRSLMSLKCSN